MKKTKTLKKIILIEFKRLVYNVDKENCLALQLMGNNKEKKWFIVGYGKRATIIEKISKFAGSTENGNLQYKSGWTTPEKYIRNWRIAIKNAKKFSDLDWFLSLYGYVKTRKKLNEKKWIKSNSSNFAYLSCLNKDEGRDKVYMIRIKEPSDLKEYFNINTLKKELKVKVKVKEKISTLLKKN